MFVLSIEAQVLHRAIATLVALAMLMSVAGSYLTAEAANLTNVSDTLTDSDKSALSNHTIDFTIPNGSTGIDASGEAITVTFPTGFTMGSVAVGDVDIEINGTDGTVVDGLSPAANQWGFDLTGQVLTLQSGGGTATATAADVVTIKVGTNADGGVNQVANHANAGSYEFVIDVASGQDTGRTRVAILDNVDVTARVDTSFDFTVSGINTAGTGVNGTSTTGTTTDTALPFGTLTAGQIKTLAQELSVSTNAIQGFVVTVEQDQNLMSSTGADIDGFKDGSYVDDPEVWAAPTNTLADEHTWGHWGLTTDDTDLEGAGIDFGSNEWVAASTTPRAVMAYDGPTNGTTMGVGTTTVGYQVEITALQEAADDYNTTLTYIATPTF